MQDGDHAKVAIAPPLLFLSALVIALGSHLLVPLPAPWPAELRLAGLLLLVGGFLVAASALQRMTKAGTSADPGQPVEVLVTNGPYRFTRNPIYLGFSLVFLGLAFVAGTLWGVILGPLLVLAVTRLVIEPEEMYLSSRFPQQYAEYSGRVRRWL